VFFSFFLITALIVTKFPSKRLILLTLLNITKYGALTTTISLVPNAAEILIDLMQMFRDKNSIFLLATKLLTLLLQSNKKIKVSIFSGRFETSFLLIFCRRLVIIQSIANAWRESVTSLKERQELKLVFNIFQNYHMPKTQLIQTITMTLEDIKSIQMISSKRLSQCSR
jgi:hypothetical protein